MNDIPACAASVSAGGLTHADRQILGVTLASAPIVFLLIAGLTLGGPSHDITIKVTISATVVTAGLLICENLVSVRRVDIDSAGVTFRYLMHSEHGNWEQLEPSGRPPRNGMWVIIQNPVSGSRVRGHWITVQQAEAIVHYPSHPQWKLSEAERSELGGAG
jgi:hypothetical protein